MWFTTLVRTGYALGVTNRYILGKHPQQDDVRLDERAERVCGMGVRVAFVDDSVDLLLLYEINFQDDKRFDIVGRERGSDDVVDLARRERPDVLCLDLYLETDDSLPLIRELKEAAPGTKVIVLSGSVRDDPVLGRALAAGADAYVDKMDWVDDLKSTILRLAA
jgi:DNA-binding NarL/FixJ family response regulator